MGKTEREREREEIDQRNQLDLDKRSHTEFPMKEVIILIYLYAGEK